MKKTKKLFGVFNIVDILVILLVLLVGIVGFSLLRGKQAAETAEIKTYTYVVEGQNVIEETAGVPVIGGDVFNSTTSVYLGKVSEVSTTPYTETIYNKEKGEYEKIPVKGYNNILLSITGKGTETERDITVEGAIPKVGFEINIKGKGYAFKGIVVEVRDGEVQ